MRNQFKPRRRRSDYKGRYRPPTGVSAHEADLAYVRANIPCQWNCPARTDIPNYIKAVHEGDYARAYVINQQDNLFPGILGRICSRPCESHCRHGDPDLGEPVAICALKRVAADNKDNDYRLTEVKFGRTGKKVAVVGGGPAGLAAARTLADFGHEVTLYESMPKLGGMMLYGIPDFRVPPELVGREVFHVVRSGVTVHTGVAVGRDIQLAALRAGNDAVVLAFGCYRPRRLGIPGEDLPGVYSGLDFMMRVNEGRPQPVGATVGIIGGGFTSMDCARAARRLGADKVVIFIRGTEEDLDVTKEEIHEVKKEGIVFAGLVSPLECLGRERLTGVRFVRNRLRGAVGSSKRQVEPLDGSEFAFPLDTLIAAIGQIPDVAAVDKGLEEVAFDDDGCAPADGLFLAGDCRRGASTVIEAIGHARHVAARCDALLMGRERAAWQVVCEAAADTGRRRDWDFIPRAPMPTLSTPERFAEPAAVVDLGYDKTTGRTEASRCYLCNLRYAIHVPECIYCRWCVDLCPRNCIHLASDAGGSGGITATGKWNEAAAIVIDNERCIRCGECLRICPTQCIHVTEIGLRRRPLNGEERP